MGKTVLIYGGAGGIGQATAERVKADGFDLHLVGRNEPELRRVAGSLGAGFTVGDVRDEACARQASEAAARDGVLHGLVYAVGTINLKPIGRLTDEDFTNDFAINALGAARAAQAALPALKASGNASIVFFSTVAASQGFAAHASIAMAKGAVEGLTLALAAECAPQVRVNAIAPSLTRTPMAEPMTKSEQMANAIAGLHALQRLGDPADIGALAAFLISDKAGWITGQVIGVDGGRSTLRTKG